MRNQKNSVLESNFNIGPTERWEVHITTDKSVYSPNEVVFVEALVVGALTNVPIGIGGQA